MQVGIQPQIFCSEGGRLNHLANEAVRDRKKEVKGGRDGLCAEVLKCKC